MEHTDFSGQTPAGDVYRGRATFDAPPDERTVSALHTLAEVAVAAHKKGLLVPEDEMFREPLHLKQPHGCGCQHYALASVTGRPELVQGEEECSWGRFLVGVQAMGYLLLPIRADMWAETQVDRAWWSRTFSTAREGTPLLLTIPSLRFEGVTHMVGATLEGGGVTVYDPGAEAAQRFDCDSFCNSPYATAHEVFQVMPADASLHPSVWGPSMPHALTQSPETTIPRRIDIRRNTPAELTIRDAVDAVERAGAHPLLTEAASLLGQALGKVADYVDNGPVA